MTEPYMICFTYKNGSNSAILTPLFYNMNDALEHVREHVCLSDNTSIFTVEIYDRFCKTRHKVWQADWNPISKVEGLLSRP